jgi:hypothetical protein
MAALNIVKDKTFGNLFRIQVTLATLNKSVSAVPSNGINIKNGSSAKSVVWSFCSLDTKAKFLESSVVDISHWQRARNRMRICAETHGAVHVNQS